MKKTYNSIEEINEHRKELDEKYDDGLPKYLQDYFDNEIDKFKKTEFFKNRAKQRYKYSSEEKREYYKKRDEEFWADNDYEIIKKEKRLGKHLDPVYEEPDVNTEKLDDEKDLSEEDIKMLITMCEEDLYLFAIRYFSHYLKKPSSGFHKYIYNFLTSNINQRKRYTRGFKHAVAAPRGNAKSSIISNILPLWCIAYNKKKFIIIISDTIPQAIDFLSDIKREIDHNVLLQRDFPHIVGKGPTWKLDEVITNNDIKVMALGTKSKVRGRKFGIHRPGLIVCDDLENSDMVRSEAERTWIRNQWFNKDLMHVHGEKGTFTDILVVGTILGKEALLTALLDPSEYPDWTSKRFKAVHEFSESDLWDEWEDLYKNRFDENRIDTARKFYEDHKEEMLDGTIVLWPEGDPYYDLMVEKISDYSAFLSEKQNNPLDPSLILVPLENIRFENFSEEWIKNIIKNKRNLRYGSLDPSLGKKNKKGDYSCITMIIRDLKSGYIFVSVLDIKRRSVDDQIKAILKYHYKYKYKLFAVETNAFQLVVADTLRKYSREAGLYVPIKDVIVKNDKKMRFERHIPIIEDGTVIFDKQKYNNSNMYFKAIEQITTFIGDGKDTYDDAVDGLTLALDLVTQRVFKRRTKQNR